MISDAQRDNSLLAGYDIAAGEKAPMQQEIDDAVKSYAKLQNVPGYLPNESDAEEGILRYLVQSYYREDVLRFLAGGEGVRND